MLDKLIAALPPMFIILVVLLGVVFNHQSNLVERRTEVVEKLLTICMEQRK